MPNSQILGPICGGGGIMLELGRIIASLDHRSASLNHDYRC